MVITAVYAVAAMVLAPSIFVATEWNGADLPQWRLRLSYSVLAALLWPVLALGLVQFAVILTVHRVVRAHPEVEPRLTVRFVPRPMGTPAS